MIEILSCRKREINPYYDRQNVILVTSSIIRVQFAKESGIKAVSINLTNDPEKETQKKAAREIGYETHGFLPVKRDKSSPSLPLELAIDKARSIVDCINTEDGSNFNPEGKSIITVDSVYKITFPNGEELILQKPQNKEDQKNILEILRTGMEVGARISNLTGICRIDFSINKDPSPPKFSAWTLELDFGVLQRNFQILDELKRRMIDNGHYASGFSSVDLFSGFFHLASLERQFKIKIRQFLNQSDYYRISPEIIERQGLGGIDFQLSNDPSNYKKIIALTLGIFP